MKHQRLAISEEQFWKEVEQFSVYKTDFFEVKTSHAGEIRMGPEYRFVKVYSKGAEIWDGGSNIYGAESFKHNVLGEKFHKLILIKWFSVSDPHEQTVVEINLATGEETKLDMHQRYWEAGHFNSFDGAFYKKAGINDYLCKDFGTREDFLLFERIREKISKAFAWTVSSVADCIIVYAKESADNVILYNIRRKEIVDFMTLDFQLSERVHIVSRLNKTSNELMVRCNDYSLAKDNSIIDGSTAYYKIGFQ